MTKAGGFFLITTGAGQDQDSFSWTVNLESYISSFGGSACSLDSLAFITIAFFFTEPLSVADFHFFLSSLFCAVGLVPSRA